ncbi:MAG: winged helix-turn-helix transcriptional regulator [Gammaproteobacteria bacterium]|nr:winged helix-turn-helix transcriptional regulator [Gammaproteobacteria bacterium]
MQEKPSRNACTKATPLCNAAERASRLSKAMSNRHRLLILFLLLEHEFPVGHINARLGLSPSGCSQHLAVLKREGLVQTRRSERNIFYSLKSTSEKMLISRLYEIYG